MIILLPLLRKLSIRSRTIVGSVLTAVGLVAVVVAAAGVSGLLVDGVIAAVVGVIFLASAWSSARRGRGPAVATPHR